MVIFLVGKGEMFRSISLGCKRGGRSFLVLGGRRIGGR